MPTTAPNQIDTICAIVIGKSGDSAQAQKMVKASQACPFVALYTAKNDIICGIFTLPRLQQEWAEYPVQKPRFLDFEEVLITLVTDKVTASSPYSRGDELVSLDETSSNQHIKVCSRYPEKCSCCPATLFYYAAE
jgi:hypothetical protein